MNKFLMTAATLLALALPAAAACVTEQQVIDGLAQEGLAEYRRGGPVVTSEDGEPADLAIAFLDKMGDGVGVWFRGGCVANIGQASKEGADEFFEHAVVMRPPI